MVTMKWAGCVAAIHACVPIAFKDKRPLFDPRYGASPQEGRPADSVRAALCESAWTGESECHQRISAARKAHQISPTRPNRLTVAVSRKVGSSLNGFIERTTRSR